MKKLLLISVLLIASITGCTDAGMSKLFSYGDSAKITCYSGGEVIYSGYSTGKIKSEENSDGYYFRDKSTNLLMEVSGNCVVTYK